MFPSQPEAVINGTTEYGENQQPRKCQPVPPGVDADWKSKSVARGRLADRDDRLITVSCLQRKGDVDYAGNMFDFGNRGQFVASRVPAGFEYINGHRRVAHLGPHQIEHDESVAAARYRAAVFLTAVNLRLVDRH